MSAPPSGPPPSGPPPSEQPDGAWRRLASAFAPRASRAQLLAGLLCGLLGFALVVQTQARSEQDLSGLRQSDLVRILQDVTERGDRLDAEARELTGVRDELRSGNDRAQAALEAAQQRATTLGILAGTIPATGPGVVLTVTDPDAMVGAATLLDAVQEIRDAGGEAMQVTGRVPGGSDDAEVSVRVVASTSFTDTDDGVSVDSTALAPPYSLTVIGDPDTVETALRIPGGFLESIEEPATARIRQSDEVLVDAVVSIARVP